MSGLRFAFAMAWRDIRASWRRMGLLTGAVLAGVAALVAINSFTDNLRVSLAEQAQSLLGADLSLRSREPLDTSAAATALLDSLVRLGGDGTRVARSTSFTAMAYLRGGTTARLVQVRSVDPGWPYYGAVRTTPAGAWPRLQDGAILVDPSLLGALGASVGDTLALGDGRYPIAGTVVSVPGEVGLQAAFGARVFVAERTLPATNLLGFGARVEHETFVQLPRGIDAQTIARANRAPLRADRIAIRTIADDRDDLTRSLTRLASYLGLVGLAALLLGGLGTASAVRVLVQQRLDGIAALRCLGATSWQVIGALLLEATAMGLLGSLLGAGLGVAIQQLLPGVLRDFLPVDVRVVPSPRAIAMGIGLGLWTATGFALLPMLGIRAISPLATLRRMTEPPRVRWDALRAMALLALAASVVGLATVQVGSLRRGAWFAGGAALALAVLWLASLVMIRLARRLSGLRVPYLVRQGLANLHRPGNQTVTVVVVLGFGAFLLATLFTAQLNLLGPLRVDIDPDRPNMVLFDIQDDQREVVRAAVRDEGATAGDFVPIVPMRLEAINGTPVAQLLDRGDPADSRDEGRPSPWALRREYRSTYRGDVGPAERVVRGAWPAPGGTGRTAEDPVAISVEEGLAEELHLSPGDRLTWNVQGAQVHAVVRALRTVEWARFEPNFFVVFAPGALETAPQSWVTLARVPDPIGRGRIQRALAERAANVTSVDLGEVQRALESVVTKIILAIRFMALFSLTTGAVVLIGAIVTSRWQRIREGTLLRTLGATRGQVLRILFVEYAALGAAAALVAVALAATAGWALARWLFETPFTAPVGAMAALAAGLVALTTIVGLATSLDVLRRPPLEVLRAD